ncbi:hypothetical protein FSARC_7651 [Fusarium sarcochroum]|uniref:Transcription regulator Rua1 C-terminal domain-containing protein n=1 Tax=Fusarium sarcochroum TaxID=1208366 RepID=A0A8H4TUI9_9HYPO|nr:hypothetical protein FSARC_7651 [Fusarium sarcochroum]
MNSNGFTENESVLGSGEMWSYSTTQCHPWATYNCDAQSYSVILYGSPSSVSLQQSPSETTSRPGSMGQDLYPPTTMDDSSWMENPFEVQFNLQGEGFSMATNEAIPMFDLKHGTFIYEDQMAIDDGSKLHCMSESSSFTPTSSRYYDGSSPAVSGPCSDLSINQSHGSYISSSFRNHNHRYSPYEIEGSRLKRSQITANTSASHEPVQHGHQAHPDVNNSHQNFNSNYFPPAHGAAPLPFNYFNFQAVQKAPLVLPSIPVYPRDDRLLSTQPPSQTAQQHPWQTDGNHFAPPQPILSRDFSRVLQSNEYAACLKRNDIGPSDPPELYSARREDQIPPPPEDMNPEDPDKIPYERELRFEGDLYTPRWVRGYGKKREGWCGICKPGRWLVLKDSAFWYDKSFSHGISAATGRSFQEPQQKRRMDGNPDVWEGLCGSCERWVALVSSKKKGTTWFRHAYKCHTHLKVKGTSKRRR